MKQGQELIIKVTFDAGEYQGTVVQKAYSKMAALQMGTVKAVAAVSG